jgi:hypothetical protein
VQEVIPLDAQSGELKLTVAYYYLPSGRLVHRKKDATDWGVEPQIVVPMDAAADRKLVEDNALRDQFHRPVAAGTTQATTAPAMPLDVQLQRAVDTMIATLVLSGDDDRSHRTRTTGPSISIRLPENFLPESPDSTSGPPTTQPVKARPAAPRPIAPTTAPATAPGAPPDDK